MGRDAIEELAFCRVQELCEDYSEFQMRHFVVDATGITLYGRWRQSLRELSARYDTRRNLKRQLATHKLEVQHYKRWVIGKLRRSQRALKVESLEDQIIKEEQQLAENKRSMEILIHITDESREKLGDVSDREALELEHWTQKLAFDILVTRMAGAPPDRRLLEVLAFLPDESRLIIQASMTMPIGVLKNRFETGTQLQLLGVSIDGPKNV